MADLLNLILKNSHRGYDIYIRRLNGNNFIWSSIWSTKTWTAVVDDDEDAKKDETRIIISHYNTNTNNISNRKRRHCDGTQKTAPSHRIVGFRIYPLLFGEHDANGKNPFLRWDTNLTFSHFIEKLTVWNDNWWTNYRILMMNAFSSNGDNSLIYFEMMKKETNRTKCK